MSSISDPTDAPSLRTSSSTVIARRIGLILAAVLAAGDLITALSQFASSDAFGVAISAGILVAAIATLALVPLSWGGRRWSSITIVVLRLVSAVTALPAFFFPGVPTTFVVLAAVGLVLAVASAVLVLIGMRSRR
jgi:hypothetical protein